MVGRSSVESFDLTSLHADSPEGYIFEVDLDYPAEHNDLHKDLPFCPEHAVPLESKQAKLLTTLYNKEKYVIHYLYLQQALKHGLKLKKVHKILEFDQSPWFKKYIDLNSRLRQESTTEFDKYFYKLMNNSTFGKTMENVKNHEEVKIVTKWEGRYGAEALISRPNFHSCTIFNPNLVAIEMDKLEVVINKPIYIGMCVLDISKTVLYEFHYNFARTKFGSNC